MILGLSALKAYYNYFFLSNFCLGGGAPGVPFDPTAFTASIQNPATITKDDPDYKWTTSGASNYVATFTPLLALYVQTVTVGYCWSGILIELLDNGNNVISSGTTSGGGSGGYESLITIPITRVYKIRFTWASSVKQDVLYGQIGMGGNYGGSNYYDGNGGGGGFPQWIPTFLL